MKKKNVDDASRGVVDMQSIPGPSCGDVTWLCNTFTAESIKLPNQQLRVMLLWRCLYMLNIRKTTHEGPRNRYTNCLVKW